MRDQLHDREALRREILEGIEITPEVVHEAYLRYGSERRAARALGISKSRVHNLLANYLKVLCPQCNTEIGYMTPGGAVRLINAIVKHGAVRE